LVSPTRTPRVLYKFIATILTRQPYPIQAKQGKIKL
jgi:hypothetical protein